MREEGGLLLVDVALGDVRAPVIVDTGSALSLTLTPEALARSGAPFDGATRTFRDARGNVIVARGVMLPEVRLGDAVFHDVRAWESVHAPDWSPPVEAGHIGRGLLAATRLTVDVPRGTLHADGPGCTTPGGATLPLTASADGLTTETNHEGRTLTLAWDTAATASVLRDTSGRKEPVPISIAPGLQTPFTPMDLPGLPVDGLVGVEVFRSRTVVFDLERGVLRIR